MAEIKGSGGEDPTKAIVAAMEEQKDALSRDYADLWFQESNEWLLDAAERRAELGVSKGRTGRAQNNLSTIADKAIQPQWSDKEDAWVFSYPHRGAIFQEFGAIPHEIRAKRAEVLAFEWPDAPNEVKEQFEDLEGDLVLFESIQHPGIPAIGFVRYGREQAARRLKKNGHDATEFEP